MVRLVMVAVALGVTGCGGSGETRGSVDITDAYAAEPVNDESAAVYLDVWNPTDAPDTLVGATTPVAAMAHLHRQVGRGPTMQMETVAAAEVPARGWLRLEPGSMHLMLMTLSPRPVAGDTLDLTLEFRHAGPITIRVPVVTYVEVAERAAAEADARR